MEKHVEGVSCYFASGRHELMPQVSGSESVEFAEEDKVEDTEEAGEEEVYMLSSYKEKNKEERHKEGSIYQMQSYECELNINNKYEPLYGKVGVIQKLDRHTCDIVKGSSDSQGEGILEIRCSMAKVSPRDLLDVSASALVDENLITVGRFVLEDQRTVVPEYGTKEFADALPGLGFPGFVSETDFNHIVVHPPGEEDMMGGVKSLPLRDIKSAHLELMKLNMEFSLSATQAVHHDIQTALLREFTS